MATVVVSAYRVATKPEIGGHFWVYLQYAHALRRLGCDVVWLEKVPDGALSRSPGSIPTFMRRMARHGLARKVILYESGSNGDPRFIGVKPADAEAVFRRADLLLNFHYAIDPTVLSRFRRTALVDIDPGLLQFWIAGGQLQVAPHDFYLTTGETVGTPGSRIDDCGLPWMHIRPPVCLDLWPYKHDAACRRFTTVSSWLAREYLTEGDRVIYQNDKSVSFLRFAELPSRASCELELALYLEGRVDAEDRELLERHGWRVRHALEVAGSPERYRAYIQSSRGEFSCVKPSCVELQNAWVSDRSLCYLASGKPVVVQDTGVSAFLPDGEGMFRFSTIDEAADALAAIDADYERHCRAAREIAETLFDAEMILAEVLELTETSPRTPTPSSRDS
jgi:glycosyltransferase involved in cell wall biosynthesis